MVSGCSDVDLSEYTQRRPSAPTPDTSGQIRQKPGWPTFGHDSGNTGHADDVGPKEHAVPAWRDDYQHDGRGYEGYAHPVVGEQYAFVPIPGTSLRALSLKDGERAWEGGLGDVSTPAIGDGTVYLRAAKTFSDEETSKVVAIDTETFDIRWETELPSSDGSDTGVTVGHDTVYVSGGPKAVYALATNGGGVRWESPAGIARGAPALADDRLFVTTDNGLRSYDATTGERIWGRDVPAVDPPSVAGEHVYVGSKNAEVRQFTLDGDPGWRAQVDGPVHGTPSVADDLIVAATTEGSVYALAVADGSDQWRVDVGGAVEAPVAIADGLVHVPTYREDVVALSLTDGSEQWRYWQRAPVQVTPAVSGGRVLVVGQQYQPTLLENLKSGLTFPDIGSWHYVNGDRANTGRAPNATLPPNPSVTRSFGVGGSTVLVSNGRVVSGGFVVSANSGYLDWRIHPAGQVFTIGDGTVFGRSQGMFGAYALAPDDGAVDRRWGQEMNTVRATFADGTVYVAAVQPGQLVAVDAASGDVEWSVEHGDGLSRPPAVKGRHVYSGTTEGDLLAVHRDSGSITARKRLTRLNASTVAVHNGRAFVGTVLGDVVALTIPECREVWRSEVDYSGDAAALRAPPAVTDQHVFVADLHGGVYSFDPESGDRLAHANFPNGFLEGPKVVGETVLVGTLGDSEKPKLYALAREDLSKRWSLELAKGELGNIAPLDGRIFVSVGNEVFEIM